VKTRPPAEASYEYDPKQGLSTLGAGWFVPYVLCDWELSGTNVVFSPGWSSSQPTLNRSVVGGNQEPTVKDSRYNKLALLPNVDIVFTSDTSKWSRCVVVETASYLYTSSAFGVDPNVYKTESPSATKPRVMFDVRYSPSVGKVDADGDGKPDPDGAVAPPGAPDAGKPILGMGWFPGYAVDVETGKRLNIFFGENSMYSKDLDPGYTGRDMLWNPTSQAFRDAQNVNAVTDFVMGGHHYVYVMYSEYDGCEAARRRFAPELNTNSAIAKVSQMKNVAWAGMLQLTPGAQLKPLNQGLIPNDVTIKLRVSKPYETWYNDNDNGKKTGHPVYQFKIENREAQRRLEGVQIQNVMDSIKVVPNPYYGFSQYEISQFSNTIKITNLPAKCTVTIYSLDGKFIRQYKRDEVYQPYQQIAPDLEWDLKNNKGIPVASGVYLIHINAPDLGEERTIKWFGIARQFDPSGL